MTTGQKIAVGIGAFVLYRVFVAKKAMPLSTNAGTKPAYTGTQLQPSFFNVGGMPPSAAGAVNAFTSLFGGVASAFGSGSNALFQSAPSNNVSSANGVNYTGGSANPSDPFGLGSLDLSTNLDSNQSVDTSGSGDAFGVGGLTLDLSGF